MESVFVRDYPEEFLAHEYAGLATTLMAQVGDDPQHLALEAWSLLTEKKELAGSIACALRAASHDEKLSIPMLQQLVWFGRTSNPSLFPLMRQLCAVLSQNPGTEPAALNNWGSLLADQAKMGAGEEHNSLFEAAGRKYALALQLKPDFHVDLPPRVRHAVKTLFPVR
jgi:hypothetical protein